MRRRGLSTTITPAGNAGVIVVSGTIYVADSSLFDITVLERGAMLTWRRWCR
jgi:hypothetical protein